MISKSQQGCHRPPGRVLYPPRPCFVGRLRTYNAEKKVVFKSNKKSSILFADHPFLILDHQHPHYLFFWREGPFF